MKEEVKISENVLTDARLLLEKAIQSLQVKNILDLERISNETIHNASIYQDSVSINVAVITFSIFKLEEKASTSGTPLPIDKFIERLTELHELIHTGRIRIFNEKAKELMHELDQVGRKINQFNIIDRSGIKKGGKIYDHGISVAQAASALNLSQWEMYNYIGRTKLNDYPEDLDKRVKHRIDYTRGLFS
jgi:hypothetical protein